MSVLQSYPTHSHPVTVPFSYCLKGTLSLSPTSWNNAVHNNSYAFHQESTHSVSVSPSCARTGISNACLSGHPPQLQRTEDRGFPHRAVAAAQRHFCCLGVASNFALWLDNHILFNRLETLSDDTKSATHSQWIVWSWEHGGRASRQSCPSKEYEPILTAHSNKQVTFNTNRPLWAEETFFLSWALHGWDQ